MRRTTITLPNDLAELIAREAKRRKVSVSALIRSLVTESLLGSELRPRVIPWAGIARQPGKPAGKDMEDALAKEWAHDLDRDRHRG